MEPLFHINGKDGGVHACKVNCPDAGFPLESGLPHSIHHDELGCQNRLSALYDGDQIRPWSELGYSNRRAFASVYRDVGHDSTTQFGYASGSRTIDRNEEMELLE